jgi:hypothetical protein
VITQDQAATFKWSRNNGAVVAEWAALEGDRIVVRGVRDQVRGFRSGQWVELTDDVNELRGEPGTLVKLATVDGEVLTVEPTGADDSVVSLVYPGKARNPKVRGWDHSKPEPESEAPGVWSEDAVVIEQDQEILLEEGIRIKFHAPEGAERGVYKTGDYWLIPARTATGDVEWPTRQVGGKEEAIPLPPRGIAHHYAPLAIVQEGVPDPTDLRLQFTPSAEPVPAS